MGNISAGHELISRTLKTDVYGMSLIKHSIIRFVERKAIVTFIEY